MSIISICNQKGGCGKTTTAINMSTCMAERGKKILLIDLDPQSHASIGLGIDIYKLDQSMYEVLIDSKVRIDNIIKPIAVENLSIAPSNINLSGAEIDLVNMIGRENTLKDNIEEVLADFDHVIIDCPPSLGLLTVNALTAAEYLLIPIQTHYFPLEGMKQLFKTVEIVKRKLNHDLDILGILATLFDKRTNVSKEVLEGIKSYFGDKVFDTIISVNARLIEAPSAGQPITIYDPSSTGAKNYTDLADEVLFRLDNLEKIRSEKEARLAQQVQAQAAV